MKRSTLSTSHRMIPVDDARCGNCASYNQSYLRDTLYRSSAFNIPSKQYSYYIVSTHEIFGIGKGRWQSDHTLLG